MGRPRRTWGCSVEGCDGLHLAKGYCRTHYWGWKTHGDPTGGPARRGSVEERFWRFVDKESKAPCWEWTGSRYPYGHGQLSAGGRGKVPLRAHRVSYELHCGEIPEGLVVIHRCDNPWCVNPKHLRVGTQLDNIEDMHAKGRARNGTTLGVEHHNARLTDDMVRAIRASKGVSKTELGRIYGVNRTTIARVLSGDLWSHVK